MSKNKKVHRSEESMLALVSQWQSSGMSQNIFCKCQGLPYSVFQYWLKKFRKSSGEDGSEFIEMKVSEEANQAEGKGEIEVIFPSGAKVIFKACPDVSFIRSLVI
jgi:hypothetical protein